jgi:hypothetical protein
LAPTAPLFPGRCGCVCVWVLLLLGRVSW